MRQIVFGLAILICIQGCKSNKEKKIHKGDFDLVGDFVNDTLPHGSIKFYDKKNQLVAIRNYTSGILNGNSTNYYLNGNIYENCNYVNDKKIGFDCIFDSLGNLTYKAYYFYGQQIGPVYTYNSSSQIVEYSFNNFEGDILYYYSYDSINKSKSYPEDKFLIKATTTNMTIDGESGVNVFLYLIQPPYLKINYKICLFNTANKIVDSFVVPENNFYFERFYKAPLYSA